MTHWRDRPPLGYSPSSTPARWLSPSLIPRISRVEPTKTAAIQKKDLLKMCILLAFSPLPAPSPSISIRLTFLFSLVWKYR